MDNETPSRDNIKDTGKSGFMAVFANRSFMLLWVAMIVSSVGDRFNQMAILSLAPEHSEGSYQAMINFFSMLPAFVFGFFNGYIIDRFNRKGLLIMSDIGRAAIVLLLIIPALGTPAMFGILFSLGCFAAIFSPAKSAIVPTIVPRETLLPANSLISSVGLVGTLVGGIIAGKFIDMYGYDAAIWFDAVTFLFSFALIFFMFVPKKSHRGTVRPNIFGEIRKGMRYILDKPLVQAFILFEMLFWFSAAMFHITSTQCIFTYLMDGEKNNTLYGVMMAMLGGGMLTGGLIFGKWGKNWRLRKLYPRITFALGIFITVFGIVAYSKNLMYQVEISALFLFLAGFSTGMFLIPISYSLQRIVPDHMLGRVFSTKWMLSMLVFLTTTLLGKWLLETITHADKAIILIFSLGGLIILLAFYLLVLAMSREMSMLGALNALWYWTLHTIGRALCTVFFRMKIHGRENVPRNCAVIVVSNHASYLDPIFLGVALPRRIYYMMTDRFYNGRAKIFFRSVRAISVKEAGGNVAALRAGLGVLRKNNALGLFPEGHLSPDGEIHPLQPGAAAMACREKVWIQPAYIDGNFKTWPKGANFPRLAKITVRFGKPFKPAHAPEDRKAEMQNLTAKIDSAIRELRDMTKK